MFFPLVLVRRGLRSTETTTEAVMEVEEEEEEVAGAASTGLTLLKRLLYNFFRA